MTGNNARSPMLVLHPGPFTHTGRTPFPAANWQHSIPTLCGNSAERARHPRCRYTTPQRGKQFLADYDSNPKKLGRKKADLPRKRLILKQNPPAFSQCSKSSLYHLPKQTPAPTFVNVQQMRRSALRADRPARLIVSASRTMQAARRCNYGKKRA